MYVLPVPHIIQQGPVSDTDPTTDYPEAFHFFAQTVQTKDGILYTTHTVTII
jgi:hypothetical protein